MFDNIGGKIKGLASFFCIAGIIISIISGFVMMVMTLIFPGVIVMLVGSLVSWISSFALYGFGDLVESSRGTYELLRKQDAANTNSSQPQEQNPSPFEAASQELRDMYESGAISFEEFMQRRDQLQAQYSKKK